MQNSSSDSSMNQDKFIKSRSKKRKKKEGKIAHN